MTKKSENQTTDKTSKKTYETPKLYKHGNIRDFTRTTPVGAFNDGGAHPSNLSDINPHSGPHCVGGVTEVDEHRILMLDNIAQDAFKKAIEHVVKPGDVVLDLGTGTGVHAMFAVQAGASKVYAIDSSAIIAVAEEIVRDNGMDDKIEFVVGRFDEVELPEKVDVIITHTGFMVTMSELPKAINKWLKPDGRLVPESIHLSFAPVEAGEEYKKHVDFWNDKKYGLDFSAFRKYSASYPHVGLHSPEDLLAKPTSVPAFDFTQKPEHFVWDLEFVATRTGFISGILGWYEYNLSPGNQISAGPPMEMQPQLWKQPLLPMQQPIPVKEGQKISCRLGMYWDALPYGDAAWKWTLEIDGERFENSSFNSVPLNKKLLGKFKQVQ